jgi:hypothetical protein
MTIIGARVPQASGVRHRPGTLGNAGPIRHELKDTSAFAQPEQRNTCPPSAAVRHRSMADMTFSCPRLRRVVARHAGPWLRKMSATSSMRCCRVWAYPGGRRSSGLVTSCSRSVATCT